MELLEERPGLIIFKASGKGSETFFEGEAGGHRFQRIPPTERRGRVQTSTVTVAVLPEVSETEVVIDEKDLSWSYCRGSGAGGQHRNVTDSAVILRHIPTGISIRCEAERRQDSNKRKALELLRAKIWNKAHQEKISSRDSARREQRGAGCRGDKRRTISIPRNSVVDHKTGKTWTFKRYAKGEW